MKKLALVLLLVVGVSLVAAACSSPAPAPKPAPAPAPAPKPAEQPKTTTPPANEPKKRTADEYAAELKKLTGATEVGKVIFPTSNEVRYPFLPLTKDGKTIAYGTWTTNTIYNHSEDLIAAVNPDGTLMNFMPIDANEKHMNVKEETWRKKFFGMKKDRDFNTKADLATGSTYSTNTFFFELKNMLSTYDLYIKPTVNAPAKK